MALNSVGSFKDLLCNGGHMSSFFAFLKRMRFINRWSLMRNTEIENIQEHSLEVAMVAHNLGAIKNEYFGGNVDINKVAVIAMYHEVSEIFTGDMPTPVKYYNADIKDAHKEIEETAARNLLDRLPDDMVSEYEKYLLPKDDVSVMKLVKAADKISALIKCIEEEKTGNREFNHAKESTYKAIKNLGCDEADIFCKKFVPEYEKTLDELN